jgi:hypothetical protein
VLTVNRLVAERESVGDAALPELVGGACGAKLEPGCSRVRQAGWLTVVEQGVAAVELADCAVGDCKGLADESDGGKGDGGDLDHFEGGWGVAVKLLEGVERLDCWFGL